MDFLDSKQFCLKTQSFRNAQPNQFDQKEKMGKLLDFYLLLKTKISPFKTMDSGPCFIKVKINLIFNTFGGKLTRISQICSKLRFMK